jgi:hypothetical protein
MPRGIRSRKAVADERLTLLFLELEMGGEVILKRGQPLPCAV